jgi:hypothetical protein
MMIDMVFTYVDGEDPAHVARRDAARRKFRSSAPGVFAGTAPAERHIWYHGVSEITYSVRSVVKFLPWVRQIFIVTDQQLPPVDRELLASGRVVVVDHRDIVPEIYRPVFASTIIESFLHRIPGLSDIYLYNNDDFMHGSRVSPEDFAVFAADALKLRLRSVPAALRELIRRASDLAPKALPRANPYTVGISNACRLLHQQQGLGWTEMAVPRHVTQVYRVATARRVENELAGPLHAVRQLHFRSHRQISWSTLAYSLERRWFGAATSPLRGASPFRPDELFLDFGRYRSLAAKRRAWARLEGSAAKFLCLNNVPPADKKLFEETMRRMGLGAPVLSGEQGPVAGGPSGLD